MQLFIQQLRSSEVKVSNFKLGSVKVREVVQ